MDGIGGFDALSGFDGSPGFATISFAPSSGSPPTGSEVSGGDSGGGWWDFFGKLSGDALKAYLSTLAADRQSQVDADRRARGLPPLSSPGGQAGGTGGQTGTRTTLQALPWGTILLISAVVALGIALVMAMAKKG